MADAIYSSGEITALGEAIYKEKIRSRVDSVEKGKFVVIDVETGDYEIDGDDAVATRRLLKRRPDEVTYGVRVGYRAAYSFVGEFGTLKGDDCGKGVTPTTLANQHTPETLGDCNP